MKTVLLCSLAATAAAFAPAQQQARSVTSLNEFAKGYVGNEGPEPMFFENGSKDFDPFGLTEVRGRDEEEVYGHEKSHSWSSQRAPEWLPWFREAELKHCRVAMLAVVGFVVPEFVRIPGEQFSFSAVPNVIDAHDALPDSMIQIFGWISFLEACTWAAVANMNEFDRVPGEFGFDPLGLYPKDAAKQKEMQIKELKNGRLAMIAIGGMVAQSVVTGHGFPYI